MGIEDQGEVYSPNSRLGNSSISQQVNREAQQRNLANQFNRGYQNDTQRKANYQLGQANRNAGKSAPVLPGERGNRAYENIKSNTGKALDTTGNKIRNFVDPKPAIKDSQRIGQEAQRIGNKISESQLGKAAQRVGEGVKNNAAKVGESVRNYAEPKGGGAKFVGGIADGIKKDVGGVGAKVGGAAAAAGGAVAEGFGAGGASTIVGGLARTAGTVGVIVIVNSIAESLAKKFSDYIFGDENDGRGGDTYENKKVVTPPFLGGQVAGATYNVTVNFTSYEILNCSSPETGWIRQSSSDGSTISQLSFANAVGPVEVSVGVVDNGCNSNNLSYIIATCNGNTFTQAGSRYNRYRSPKATILAVRTDGTSQAADIAAAGSTTNGGTESYRPTIVPNTINNTTNNTTNNYYPISPIIGPSPQPILPPSITQPAKPAGEPIGPPLEKPIGDEPKPTAPPPVLTRPIIEPYSKPASTTRIGAGTAFGSSGQPIGAGGPSFNKGGNGLRQGTGGGESLAAPYTPIAGINTSRILKQQTTPNGGIDLTKLPSIIPNEEPLEEPTPGGAIVDTNPIPRTQTKTQPKTETPQDPYDPCLVKDNVCATNIKDNNNFNTAKLQHSLDQLKALLTVDLTGQFQVIDCKDTTKTYDFLGQGIAGLSSKIGAIHESLKVHAYKEICELDTNINIPDWWQHKIVDNPPTLCLQFAPKLASGRLGSANTVINIPYFKGEKGLVDSLKGLSYTKGNINGIWHLKSGKVIVLGKTDKECEKIFSKVKLLIDPKYVSDIYHFPLRKGNKPIGEKQVFLKFAVYYPEGILSVNEKAWTVEFKP